MSVKEYFVKYKNCGVTKPMILCYVKTITSLKKAGLNDDYCFEQWLDYFNDRRVTKGLAPIVIE